MIEKIKQYPHETLVVVCDPIDLEDKKNRFLVKRLNNAMLQDRRGRLAVAAPQIGVTKRAFVWNIPQFKDGVGELPFKGVVFNPVITSYSKGMSVVQEGCLSLKRPAMIKRPITIEVEFFDPQGNQYTGKVWGMAARVFQHEVDHLDGILITDRISGGRFEHA